MLKISPEYFRAAGTSLLSGRAFTWHDDKDAPPEAVINQELARKIFGSVDNALGKYYKTRDGARIQVVGIVEDGKYETLAEEPQPAVFLPILQSPSSQTYLEVRGDRGPQQRGCRTAVLHPNLESTTILGRSVSVPSGNSGAGSAGCNGRDAGSYRYLWNGDAFSEQAPEGIGDLRFDSRLLGASSLPSTKAEYVELV
jgi:hypothetical protein